MLAVPGPEALAKFEEVLLEDRVLHGSSSAFDDLVFQGSHCKRVLTARARSTVPSSFALRLDVRAPAPVTRFSRSAGRRPGAISSMSHIGVAARSTGKQSVQ